MSTLYIHTDTADGFPGFVEELTAAGADVVVYDDHDYVLDDELRAKVDASINALDRLDDDELAERLDSTHPRRPSAGFGMRSRTRPLP